jgi:undecaprenyl diphosphate synthase
MSQSLLTHINKQKVPNHIAIIMDGNGRWAKEKGKDRIFGHYEGVISVRSAVEACVEAGVNYLTLYTLNTEMVSLHKNGVRLHVIGDFKSLPAICQQQLSEAIELTKNNTSLNVVLALSYSAKWEIKEATKAIAQDVLNGKLNVQDISEDLISTYLNTAHLPDPELMIRTSGECRISNFLLYQLAYAELYFTNVHWPDFRKEHLFEAIINYQNRERRFGKISEQIINNEVSN